MTTASSASPPRARKRLHPIWAAIIYVLSTAVIVALVIGNVVALRYADLISIYTGQETQRVVPVEGEDADYFTSSFSSDQEREAYLEQVATDISREGITLIQNNGALPLASSARITVFGQDAVDPVYGGGGAGSIDASEAVSLEDSFDAAGFEVNPVLWEFYTDGPGADYRKTTPDVYGEGEFAVNEVPVSEYTDDVIASFGDYADAAVVVIGRSGGESSDLDASPGADGYTYLQLSADERDMLSLADENFDELIVVLNTQNAVELGALADYDVSATLWVGSFGQTGAIAVGETLAGTVNPSGALVDTYAYDSLSAPAMANFGDYTITNSEVFMGNKYVVYGESLYIGYYYYETRYEDVVIGAEGAGEFDYAAQVEYPFGHGMSYTEFAWEEYSVSEADEAFEATVTVTNTGDVAGKDIVQIYLQTPYTDYDRDNGIEKPAVQLAGYAKTALLEPGESETVTVSVPRESFKVYDAEGYGTYIVEPGDYVLAAGDDAHAALNNVLASKGYTAADGMTADGDRAFTSTVTVDELDTTTYAVSTETGDEITNQFADVDVSSYDSDFTYLTRADWTGTWPQTFADGAWEAPAEFLEALEITVTEDPEATTPVFDSVDEEYGELSAAMLIGEDYDNPLWGALLEQTSLDELDQLVRVGGYATQSVESIELPATIDKDGPAGFSDTLVGGESGMGYPPAVVLASSWNDDLAREMGLAIGEDGLELGYTGWYAPSMNLPRSPYSGRNFEYFSEDPTLSGAMSAAIVDGAQEKGVLVFIKHFALNDQEANRVGGSVMADEQTTRELYLAPFEDAVREADALGVMASMNRIGPVWSGGHAGLMTDTLRDEWGFQGVVITDQASFSVFAYEDLREGLRAGTDLWLNTDASLWELSSDQMTATVQSDMVRAAHNVAYAVVHSNAMNGLSAGATIESVIPLWQWTLIIADIVIGLAIAAVLFVTTRRIVRQRRENAPAVE